ncbi:MAG: hypothetical protein ABI459_02535, partial [Deltaproteobacteria bacterium]
APDHVLRDENLDTELGALCANLGIDGPDVPARVNFSAWHTEALAQEVQALWPKDYANFGYAALSR